MKRKIALFMCMFLCMATILSGCGKEQKEEVTEESQETTEEESESETEEKVYTFNEYINSKDVCIWYEVNMDSSKNMSQSIIGKDTTVDSVYIFKDGKVSCVTSMDITLGELSKMQDEEVIELATKQFVDNTDNFLEDLEIIDVYNDAISCMGSYYERWGEQLVGGIYEMGPQAVELLSEDMEIGFQNIVLECADYSETVELWNMGVTDGEKEKLIETAYVVCEDLKSFGDEFPEEWSTYTYWQKLREDFALKLQETGYAEKVKQPYIDQIETYQTGELRFYPYAFCLETDASGNMGENEYFVFGYFNDTDVTKGHDVITGSTEDSIEDYDEEEEDSLTSVMAEFEQTFVFDKYASYRFNMYDTNQNRNVTVYDTNYKGLARANSYNEIYLFTKMDENERIVLDSLESEGIYVDDFNSARDSIEVK